jgi:hypothetical protein
VGARYIKRKIRERGGPIVGGPEWDIKIWDDQAMSVARTVYLDSGLATALASPLKANAGWQYLTTAQVLPADVLIDLESTVDIRVGDVFQLVDGAFVAVLTVKVITNATRIEVLAAPGGAHTYVVGSTAGDPDNLGDLAFWISDASDAFVSVTKQGSAIPSVPTQLHIAQIGAPKGASYVVTAADADLTNEKVLGTDVVMRGTLAARPAASLNGRRYFATDDAGGTDYRDTGAAWEKVGESETHASSHNPGGADALNYASLDEAIAWALLAG